MGWNKMPLASGADVSTREFEWLIQFWEAIREREWALGTKYWPAQSQVWYNGTIGSVNPYDTIVNSSGMWWKTGNVPWSSPDSNDQFAPGSWGVFVEAGGFADYRKVLYADIVDWTSGNPGSLYVPKLVDYVVSKEITDFNDLVGKEFFIVRKNNITPNNPSLRWSDRWPQFPNTDELIYGDITSGSASGYIVDTTKHWTLDQYAGEELAIRDGSGYLHRVPIIAHPTDSSGNYLNPSDPYFENTLFFEPEGWTPTGHYAILPTGGTSGISGNIYRIGREKHQPWAWYRGAMDSVYSHYPVYTDNRFFGQTYIGASQVQWESKRDTPPFDCIIQDHPGTASAFDLDMASDIEEECGAPIENDRFYSPHIWKTWRALQVWLENNCLSFIEKKDYDGSSYIFNFVPATFFKAANIGLSYTSSILSINDDSTSNISSIDAPYYPITMHYAIYNSTPSGSEYYNVDLPPYYGTTTITNNSELPFSLGSGTIGNTVILSTGWKRFIQRKFQNKDTKTQFIPDVDEFGTVYDPAHIRNWDEDREFGVGHWRNRVASTGYIEEIEGPTEFNEGDVAWYVGSNWNDAIDGGNSFVLEDTSAYYDNAYEGIYPTDLQHDTVYAQIYGTVHEGSTYRLSDYAKNWWQDIWYGGGTGHIETGTVTTGSTTHMEDSSKQVDQQSGAFWTDRFPNSGHIPYLDFIVEFQLPTQFISSSGTTDTELRWHKRPITSASSDTSKITADWTEPLPSDPTGKAWRIREPKYEINRWRDYLVYVKYQSGHLTRSFAKYSDDNTLYFEPPLPSGVSKGDKYSIIYPHTGNTYRYTNSMPSWYNTMIDWSDETTSTVPTFFKASPSGYWMAPRGLDSVRMGVTSPSDWHSNPNDNLPTIVKRYGRFSKGDCIDVAEFYDQIYRGINALVWTPGHFDHWTSKADGVTSENNDQLKSFSNDFPFYQEGDWGSGVEFPDYQQLSWNFWMSDWQSDNVYSPRSESDGTPPQTTVRSEESDSGCGCFGGCAYLVDALSENIYAYGVITNIPTIISYNCDIYCYAMITNTDPDESDVHSETVIDETGNPNPSCQYTYNYFTGNKVKFQAMGTNLAFRQFKLVDSFANQGSSHITPKIGGATENATPEPPPGLGYKHDDPEIVGTSDSRTTGGFYVARAVPILKWDVSGGMTYIG